MRIPTTDQFLVNLVLQRTRPFIAMGGKPALRAWTETGDTHCILSAFKNHADRRAYIDAAIEEIRGDVLAYTKLAGSIAPKNFVSIGVGNGIAELLLWRHYGFSRMLLVDIETGGHWHGYSARGAGYTNLGSVVSFLSDNGVTCEVMTWNPAKTHAPQFRYDLLVSMYAMGFHFPAGEYSGFMRENAGRGSVAIYDDRESGSRKVIHA